MEEARHAGLRSGYQEAWRLTNELATTKRARELDEARHEGARNALLDVIKDQHKQRAVKGRGAAHRRAASRKQPLPPHLTTKVIVVPITDRAD